MRSGLGTCVLANSPPCQWYLQMSQETEVGRVRDPWLPHATCLLRSPGQSGQHIPQAGPEPQSPNLLLCPLPPFPDPVVEGRGWQTMACGPNLVYHLSLYFYWNTVIYILSMAVTGWSWHKRDYMTCKA